MSTPTEINSAELPETKSEPTEARAKTRGAELAADLARLETVLAGQERKQWAPRLPPASQLPRVPGLAPVGGRFADDVRPSPAWLMPERVALAPELTPRRDRVDWPVIIIAALCGLPLGYLAALSGSSPQPATSAQVATAAATPVARPAAAPASPPAVVAPPPAAPTAPPILAAPAPAPAAPAVLVAPPAAAPATLPVLARDDAADHPDAGDTLPPAGAPRSAALPGRVIVAMLKPGDRVIAAPSPAVRAPDPETVALLVRQGEQLAAAGDFAAARTLFQRAAEAGSAKAASALGATYDPTALASMRAVGIVADAVKARFWYEKAASLGSAGAGPRPEPTAFGGSARLAPGERAVEEVMLILRGVANAEYPRGALEDDVALEYARRGGFRGEVLDVAADYGPASAQIRMALERIRRDQMVTAIYGFSGGGYNARHIWEQLGAAERERIRKVIVVGAPGVDETQFAGKPDLLIKPDPPEGHMAGPRALLETLGP